MTYSVRNMLFFGIPPYWFMAGIGFSVSVTVYMFLLEKRGLSVKEHIPILGFGAFGMAIGAKLFGCITKTLTLLQTHLPLSLREILNSGIVFYGGLLGFVSFILIFYQIKYNQVPWGAIDQLAVCIPLFHAFARLGCFFSGCCYGAISDSPYTIMYETNRLEAAYRYPVQLYESIFLFCLFAVLLYISRFQRSKQNLLKIYLGCYSIVRFALEFLRGDLERGVFGGISFSQIISVVILFSIIANEIIERRYGRWKKY